MTPIERYIIVICFIAIAGIALLFLWQLNNFGKRLKKIEDQLNKDN